VALLVLHSAECAATDAAARAVAAYLAGYRGGSAHYVVGPGVVIQQVPERYPAWTCGARGNPLAIQIEMAGRAMSTDWTSGDGLRVLRRCAGLGRDICQRWHIPLMALGPDDVRAGMHGVCSHDSITRGLGGTTHVDPGGPHDARWPWETWLEAAGA
jgi:N-acetyl-anhydromuramyl-L-alanine amidase AmpD